MIHGRSQLIGSVNSRQRSIERRVAPSYSVPGTFNVNLREQTEASVKRQHVSYSDLNSRQKENFNFQKVSAILADYGFVTMRLSDDWNGADFIAIHVSGVHMLVQLKSRLTFSKKYESKGLYVAFADGEQWYLYDHDILLRKVLQHTSMGSSKSWSHGNYSFPRLSENLRSLLAEFRVASKTNAIPE